MQQAHSRVPCTPTADTAFSWAGRGPVTATAQASNAEATAAGPAEAADSPFDAISVSLKQLQHTASNLDPEPTIDGLLTAFQQLNLIQAQIRQQSRQRKTGLYRMQKGARPTTAARLSAAQEQLQAQLAALSQLCASADDAQDFLLSLVQQLLQVGLGYSC
jgi:hypothetical protein